MIFEEFFLKKKIDLVQLQEAEPDLFNQFKSHFKQMGEKSFDHTKKYWFNKLRREYPLSVEEENRLKTAFSEAKAATPEDKTLKENKSVGVVATKPAGFKPKFKATAPPVEDTQLPPTEISESKETAEVAKPAFKPRIKPGMAKPAVEPEVEKEETLDQQERKAPAPTGFKPRFKAGVTVPKKEEADAASEEVNPPQIQAEPPATKPAGFKPRFKPGVTKKAEEKPDLNEPDKEIATQTVTNKPSGFKPRFKAGVTGKKAEKAENFPPNEPEPELPPRQIEDPSDASEDKVSPAAASDKPTVDESEPKAEPVTKPIGFKPRFKAGKTK